jgi:hypothetical protein
MSRLNFYFGKYLIHASAKVNIPNPSAYQKHPQNISEPSCVGDQVPLTLAPHYLSMATPFPSLGCYYTCKEGELE